MLRSRFSRNCSRRAVFVGFIVAAIQLAPCGTAAAAPVGQVTAAQGSTFLQRQRSRLPASAGADVFLEDVATTRDQSRLDLRLGAATRIRLGSNAVFRIDRVAAGLAAATLDAGPAVIERGAGAEPSFTLRSPFALIAARGTVFFAGPSNGLFGVFVQEGTVTVSNRAGSVTLTAGQGTDIKAPGAPPTPPKLWGLARIQAALDSVN